MLSWLVLDGVVMAIVLAALLLGRDQIVDVFPGSAMFILLISLVQALSVWPRVALRRASLSITGRFVEVRIPQLFLDTSRFFQRVRLPFLSWNTRPQMFISRDCEWHLTPDGRRLSVVLTLQIWGPIRIPVRTSWDVPASSVAIWVDFVDSMGIEKSRPLLGKKEGQVQLGEEKGTGPID
jgi:hypothetical protein